MEKILFLANTEPDNSLGKPALEALGAAIALKSRLAGSQLIAGLIGENVQAAANQIAACGAEQFFGVAGPAFSVSRYGTDALAAETIVKSAQATLIIAAATHRLARCLAGVAQRVGGVVDTHVAALNAESGKVAVNRWYYRQRMEAVLSRTARPWFLLVDSGSQPGWSGSAGSATVETLSPVVTEDSQRTTVTGFREPAANAKTIRPEAALLFVAGAGWTKKQADGQAHVPEAEKCIREFLTATQASLGSTKSLVDQSGEGQAVLSFLTHMNQIGQTGATPRHAKGLSTCCHGEEPHTVGWRFIKERRAISLDPNCGWARGKADVLYVADAFKVMAKVNELLGSKG